MALKRGTPKGVPFTLVYDAVIEDKRLSGDALAVAVYLQSKPEGWIIQAADLKRRFGYGREKQQRILRTLKDCGYIVREPVHGEDGRFIRWDHLVYDLPDDPDFDIWCRWRKRKAGREPWDGE